MKIILITSVFPYSIGEVFLENELNFFSRLKNLKIKILPSKKEGSIRKYNNKFKIDNFLLTKSNKSKISKLYNFIKGLKYSVSAKEFFRFIITHPMALYHYAFSISNFSFYVDIFDKYFKKSDNISDYIIYTYWNTEITHALQFLKPKYKYKLISRVHGFDLYKEVRPYNYMPLKVYFTRNIDKIYSVSKKSMNYMILNYGIKKEKIECSYLGVKDPEIITNNNELGIFHVVSCSKLRNIKRVDKIIDSLNRVSKSQKNIKFMWTHIGDGPLRKKLETKSLNELDSVFYKFLGNIKNKEVYDFYKENKIDLFLNTSKSEGIPVSIMEAMSYGIPIIAPDVGGISEAVYNQRNGILLNKDFSIDDLLGAMKQIIYHKDIEKMKLESKSIFRNKFKLEENYSEFIKSISSINETII